MWAMKKKLNSKIRARMNSHGFEQIDGEHYNKDNIASPTINIITVRVMLVLLIMMCGYAHVTDVNGAFLLGNFKKDIVTKEEQKLYMETPQGFSQFFAYWKLDYVNVENTVW